MTFDETLATALGSANPFQAVRSLAEGLLQGGESRDAVVAKLEQARRQFHEEGRGAEEDVVLDVMDVVVDWCSPHMRIGKGT